MIGGDSRTTGRIGIDARHAVLKLREHRLADPHAYLVELARAAAAAGAKTVSVDVRGRTLELTHDGRAPTVAELARLVQYIFDAEPDDLHLRLLALAVNGALALEPAQITVETAMNGGSAIVELDAEQIDASDGTLPVRELEAPLEASLRVRFTWPLLGRRPRAEVELLADAARDASIRVAIDGEDLALPVSSVRTSFDAGTGRAFIELGVEPGPARIDFLERGFRLVTVPWRLGTLRAIERAAALRAVVDARELPTNVSRSKLQDSEDLEGRVTLAATAALERLLCSWAAELVDGASDPTVDNRLGTGDAAKHLLEACVAALLPGGEVRNERLNWMRELPLLRDATGAARRISEFDGLEEIWVTPHVQPPELGWLAERILLLEERPIDRALAECLSTHLVPAEEILKRGKAGLERRKRHLAHPESRLELLEDDYVIKGAIADTAGPFAGLKAVFGVRAEAQAAAGMRCAVHVEGRILQTLRFLPAEFPFAMDAAIAWPGKVLASIDYLSVAIIPEVDEAIGRVAAEALQRLDANDPPELLRRALALTTTLQGVAAGSPLVAPDALRAARIWQTAEPERHVSLDELEAYAVRTGALCVADEGAAAPDARPLLRAGHVETSWLERLVKPRHGLVAYPVVSADREARARAVEAAARSGLPEGTFGSLVNVGQGCVAYVCLAPQGSVIWLHQSLEVQRFSAPAFHVALAVDDPTLVPAPGWDRVLHHRELSIVNTERPLLLALLDALDDPTWVASPSIGVLESALHFVLDQERSLERDAQLAQSALKRCVEALERAPKSRRKAALLGVDVARAEVARIHEIQRRLARAPVLLVDAEAGRFGTTSLDAAASGAVVLIRSLSETDLAAPGTVVARTMDDLEMLWKRGGFVRALPMPSADPTAVRVVPPPLPRAVPPPLPASAGRPLVGAGFTRPIADAPDDCLASQRIEAEAFGIGGAVRGCVWIDRQWRPEPAILVHCGSSTTSHTLRIASVSPLDPIVPLCGEIEVHSVGTLNEFHSISLAGRMMRIAVELVNGRDDSQLSWKPYLWHLALLGQMPAPTLRVTALDGRRLGVKSVRAQLQTYRRLWFGRDPSQLGRVGRELCLLDTPSPLLAILDASPSADLVRRLGVDGSFGASAEGWLQQTVSHFWPNPYDLQQADAAGLCNAIHAALKELRLAGDPVEHVVATDSGRPVRYRALTRQVVINTASALIEIVLAEPGKPEHLEALVAAAVSEINRALSGVTDGEERRALLTRLYALPDSADRAGLLPKEAVRSMLGGPK